MKDKMQEEGAAGIYGRVSKKMQRGGRGCAAWMRRAMQKLRKWVGLEEVCTIVNKTGKPVVVRAKYKDVWEGQQWRLAAEGGRMVVPSGWLKSAEPYSRLGVFLNADPSSVAPRREEGTPLYISNSHLLACPYMTLSLSPSGHNLQLCPPPTISDSMFC